MGRPIDSERMKRPGRLRMRLRVFHGPVNIGGIARHFADWQRRRGATADFVVHHENVLFDNSHLNLDVRSYRWPWRAVILLASFLMCLARYDLFHFYFGESLLPFGLDLPILKLFGKRIIMTYCGSDIRLVHVER